MRTSKEELISDEIKPLICKKIKDARLKFGYSLEDLAKTLNYKKNRQTLHKYETGLLNIPYDILFDICRIFNIDDIDISEIPVSKETKEKFEKKFIKNLINNNRKDKDLTKETEKIINTYKNAIYESTASISELSVKITDDSMEPVYLKNDKVNIIKKENYENGDDIVIAIKGNLLAVRRLYKYPKGIILQAINPKYPTININIVSNNMILGKVVELRREIK